MKLHSILIILTATLVLSCNKDFLNKLPLDSPSDETFFSSKEELDLAINGAYTDLWWEWSSVPYVLWLDGATDIAWSRGDYANVQSIQSGQFTPDLGIFMSTWSHMYNGISKANNILENMHRAKDVVSADDYASIQAQARFLRSYFYFYLVELYGDVPWVTTILSLDSANLPRTSKADIVAHLYDDLDSAAAHLPPNWSGENAGRVTKGAALTLKARLALYEGDYQTAAAAAKAVMDLGIYGIYPNYQDLFHYVGEGSNEIILNLPYLVGVRTNRIPQMFGVHSALGSYSILVPTQEMVDMYECTDGKSIDNSPLFDPSNPFEHRDPRLDQSIIRPGMWFNHSIFETHPDSTYTRRVVGGDTVLVANPELTTYATFTGYGWLKYMDEADLPQDLASSHINVILMRYAEVLLTYAEAKIELNDIDQSVLDAINQVRGRPSVSMPLVHMGMSQDSLRKVVRYERTIELADEGFRLFDIKRWKYAEHVLPGNVYGRRNVVHWYDPIIPQIDEYGRSVYPDADKIFKIISVNVFDPSKNYLWPIPQKELDVDHNLQQNPGY
jgi:hypothetical protein